MDHISQWGPATLRLIDHPEVFPYLIELLGPELRMDLDYCILSQRATAPPVAAAVGLSESRNPGGRSAGLCGLHAKRRRLA